MVPVLPLVLAQLACEPAGQVRAPEATRIGESSADSLPARLAVSLVAGGRALPARVMPSTPHDPDARPVLNGLPAHLAFALPAGTATPGDSIHLLALPVAEYRRHYLGGARAGFDRRLGALRDIIAAGRLVVDGEIPVFPQPEADQRFRARAHWVRFEGGQGVAFVTQFSGDASPPAADELVWVFQGLTDDGAWLLSVIRPLVVRGLPASEDPRRVAAAVDTLPAEAFTPDPDHLLATVGALRLVTNPEREP